MTIEKHISGSIFKPDGLYRRDWCYDDELDEGREEETLVSDFVDILNLFEYKCEIDDNVTLIQILNALEDAKLILNAIFHFNYDAHMGSYFGYVGEKSINPDDYLEIYLSSGLDKYSDDHGVELQHYHGMHLISKDSENDIPYSVMLTPLHEIGDIPIKIKLDTELYDTDYTVKKGYKQNDSLKIDTVHYTLHDVLYAIIWELGFVGDPDCKEEAVAGLDKQIKSIEDGTAKLTEFNLDELLGDDNDDKKAD